MITPTFNPPSPSASGGAGVEVATAWVTAVAGGTGVNVAAGIGVAVGGTDVAVGTGVAVGANVAVGLGVAVAGLGVAVGMAVGVRVAVGLGVAVAGLGVAVGMAVDVCVAVGTGVAVAGLGVAVGMAIGTDVAVGTGVAVGGAVGSGVGVAGASSIVMTYVLKFVSVDTAHTAPESSVSQRCSNSVHSSPLTRYTRTRPAAHAAASAAGSANRRSTPGEYVIGVGVLLPDANVSSSAASTTRSASAGGAPGASAPSFVNRISTFDGGAAAAGTTTCTVESSVVICVGSGIGVAVIAVVGPVTLSVTNTIRGVFVAPLALMVIWPRYVPASNPEAFADTRTVTLARGLFDDADLGENDSQLASADTVNGISVCRSVFHTVNVCEGDASPPRAAVNVRKFVDKPTSGRGGSGVAVGLGVDVGGGATSPPVGVGMGAGVGVAVGSGTGVVR